MPRAKGSKNKQKDTEVLSIGDFNKDEISGTLGGDKPHLVIGNNKKKVYPFVEPKKPVVQLATLGRYCPICANKSSVTFFENEKDLSLHIRMMHELRDISQFIAINTTVVPYQDGEK